jgi:hypothetical protein
MESFITVNGTMVREMEEAAKFSKMEPSLKGYGTKERSMELEEELALMEKYTKEIGKKEKYKAKVSFSEKMEHPIQDNGLTSNSKAMGIRNGKTEPSMKAIFRVVSKMVTGY